MKELNIVESEMIGGGIGFLGGIVYGLAGTAAFKALPGVGMGAQNTGDAGANLGAFAA